LAVGFTQRGPKKKKQQPKRLPLHEDDLRNLLKVIAPAQSQRFFNDCMGEFFHAKYVRGGLSTMDGTEILVGDAKTFEGTGTIVVLKRHKDGTVTYETKTGYKFIHIRKLKLVSGTGRGVPSRQLPAPVGGRRSLMRLRFDGAVVTDGSRERL
jgi:hypothetical protein